MEYDPLNARVPKLRQPQTAPRCVTEAAHEVYRQLYGMQSLQRINERGGFYASELVAYLYARSFPREEWELRVGEAQRGLEIS